jgi:hypothetical protein
MKKVLLLMLLVAGMLSTTKFASAAYEPGVKMETLTVAKDATQVANVLTSGFYIQNQLNGYWVGRNSWGTFCIYSPNGDFKAVASEGVAFSTAGWPAGDYTATTTRNDVTEYTTFTVE